jgi:virginiamycin B lyase
MPKAFPSFNLKQVLERLCLLIAYTLSGCSGGGSPSTPNIVQTVPTTPASISSPAGLMTVAPTSDPVTAVPNPGLGILPVTQIASPSTTPVSMNPVRVNVNYSLTGTNVQGIRHGSSALRNTQYISSSNTRLTIAVTPFGGTTTSFGPTACTTSSCPISFTTVPGPTTLAFSLTDTGGTLLSQFSTVKYIQPQTLNTLSFSSNPIATSATLSLASPSVSGGTPIKDLLTINVMDPDGNTIVGNSLFVDASGTPVVFTLHVTNNQSGGKGTVGIQGPTQILTPVQGAMYAYYDGNWLASSDISITSTSASVGTLTGTTLTTIPTAYENMRTGLTNPYSIATGPDGAIWFGAVNGNTVGRLKMDGTYTAYTVTGQPNWLTSGPDGNMYVGYFSPSTLEKFTMSGAHTTYTLSNGAYGLAVGPDAYIWYVNAGNYAGRVTTDGVETTMNSGGFAQKTYSIARGSDSAMWISESGGTGARIARLDSSQRLTEYAAPTCTTITPAYYGIVLGPDGNMWFTERSNGCIGRITPSGAITMFSTGVSGTGPVCITVGPDGAMWFGEDIGNGLGRITTTGAVTSYTTGFTSGASPQCLTLGPDGNLWFTEWNAGKVGKFVL